MEAMTARLPKSVATFNRLSGGSALFGFFPGIKSDPGHSFFELPISGRRGVFALKDLGPGPPDGVIIISLASIVYMQVALSVSQKSQSPYMRGLIYHLLFTHVFSGQF
jgi:hypothetical protein